MKKNPEVLKDRSQNLNEEALGQLNSDTGKIQKIIALGSSALLKKPSIADRIL